MKECSEQYLISLPKNYSLRFIFKNDTLAIKLFVIHKINKALNIY